MDVLKPIHTRCPQCAAEPGQPCVQPDGSSIHVNTFHEERSAGRPADVEIEALKTIVRWMQPLNAEARCRILAYLLSRFGWPEATSENKTARSALARTLIALAHELDR